MRIVPFARFAHLIGSAEQRVRVSTTTRAFLAVCVVLALGASAPLFPCGARPVFNTK